MVMYRVIKDGCGGGGGDDGHLCNLCSEISKDTTPCCMRATARELLEPVYNFGKVRPGFKPATSRSESVRSTN